jgi:hypothetical protein
VDQQHPHRCAPHLRQGGFQLVEEEAHHSFGKDLVGQVLARDL